MSLSEFTDTLLPVILHFSGIISNGSLCFEVSLIRRSWFPLLRLLIIAYICILFDA
jgi:hypothetical protein